jgi:hypothetical protein
MTLREISYNILNLFDERYEGVDSDITINQIIYNVKYYRSLLLRRDMQRGSRLTPFEQEMEDTFTFKPSSSFGRNALESQSTIPTPVRLKNRDGGGLSYIGLRTGDVSYPIRNIHKQRLSKYDKFTDNTTSATYQNGKIFVFGGLPNSLSSGDTRDFEIRGIFEDPEEVMSFNGITDTINEPFPMGSDMEQRITKGLLSGELAFQTGQGQMRTQQNES